MVPLMALGIGVGALLGRLFGVSLLAEDIGLVIGFLVGGAIVRVVGKALNRDHDHHRFFGVPMRHCAWAGVALALAGVAIIVFR
ncbi:hypothetical protein N599_34130 [Saccharopolyspora erythraea D]|nr:hypothetical protein N599_34130 [Saccharopolyspora erythraea D]